MEEKGRGNPKNGGEKKQVLPWRSAWGKQGAPALWGGVSAFVGEWWGAKRNKKG